MIHPRSKERSLRLALVVAGDLLIAWGCLALAVYIRRNVDFQFTLSRLPREKFLLVPMNVLVFSVSMVVGQMLSGFYTQRISRRHKPLIAAALLLQIGLVAVAYAVLQRPVPRSILFLVPILEAVALPIWRHLLATLLPVRPRATVLIGDSSDLTALIDAALDEEARIRIVGLVGPTPPLRESVPYWGSLDNPEVCDRLKTAEQVIYVSHGHDARVRLRLFSIRGAAGFLLLPSHADALLTPANFGWVGDQPLVEIAARGGFGAGRLLKKAEDLVLVSLLVIPAAPLCVLIAIAIWLEDRRPVLIAQPRAGRDGSIFAMWKFRTMRVIANSFDDTWRPAIADDQRVTKVGRWLRRHRLDELPQLINVLRGEMSLVGPRPERPEHVSEILHEVPEFDLRLLVPPGIAGLAQVWGEYDTRAAVKLRYDLTYICSWSLWLDIRILVRAVSTVLSGRGL